MMILITVVSKFREYKTMVMTSQWQVYTKKINLKIGKV